MAKNVNLLWTDDELAGSVEAYVFMLRLERAGLSYRKEAAADVLLTGPLKTRNDASIRYRMRNISAVVNELGGPVLSSYSPAEQVGRNVRARLQSLLINNPGFQEVLRHAQLGKKPINVSAEDLRAEAINRLGILREYITDLERELLGIGHNHPPEPLSLEGLTREDFEQAREDIRALEAEIRKSSSTNETAERHVSQLSDFGLKITLWIGERATTFTDAALRVFAPLVVAKAIGLLPVLIDALTAVTQAISH